MKQTALKATLTGLLFALPFGACTCDPGTPLEDAGPGITCGEGTILKNGECVGGEVTPGEDAGPGIECGPGTIPNQAGTACIPDIDCAEGTVPNETGTGCVPACEDPFILDGDECACPAGLVVTPAGDDCVVDPALCAEGTLFDDATGQCMPAVAPAPSDDDLNPGEAPASFILPDPDENKRTEIGGIIGPVDADGGDLDVFEFDGDAGDRMLVQLISFGAQAASFVLMGIDDNTGDYFRMALPLENRRAVRHVVLPVTGRYAFIVSDRANVLQLLGIPGIPVGGADHSYSLVIDALPAVAPTTIPADGAVHTGAHDNIDAYHVGTNSAPVGSILSALLAADESDMEFDTAQVLWFIDANGNYVELVGDETPAVATLLPQTASGTVFYVDYQYRLGTVPTYSYELTVEAPIIHDGPVAGGDPVDGNTAGDNITFYEVELQEAHVYRIRMRLPDSSTIPSTELALVNTDLITLAESRFVSVDGIDYEELRFHAGRGAGGTYYIEVLDGEPQDPLQESNFNLRLTLDEAPVSSSAVLALPDTTTFSDDLDDPTDLDDDAWTGPWALVHVNGLAELTVTTSADVTFNAFRPADFSTFTGSSVDTGDEAVYGRSFRGLSGFEVLLQAQDGDQTDQFALNATITESIFLWETEPNDSAATATDLPSAFAGTPPAAEAPAPGIGECSDLSAGPRITTAGRYTATLDTLADSFDGGAWGNCAIGTSSTGNDVYYVIAQQPAGTQIRIETLPEGDNAGADTKLGLAAVPNDCSAASSTCLAYNDDISYSAGQVLSRLNYTFTGSEGDLLLIIDSWGSLGPITDGTLVFDVVLSPAPPNGVIVDGDEDWWALAVPEAGLLEVNVESGPLGGDPDMDLSIFHIDATTELVGPVPSGGGASTYVEEAGTYYAVVRYAGEAGDYQVTWSLDNTASPPVTCSTPVAITDVGDYDGDTSAGHNNWMPQNDQCFGFDPIGYDSPDTLYSYTLPAGATLRATVDSNFDAAVAILDGGCDGACLAGSDEWFSLDEVVAYQNNTGADQDVFVVVDGFEMGSYTLSVEIFGAACSLGEARCANGDMEVCNADGTAFEVVACPSGCTYDDFEQEASCNQHCGEGTSNPDARCNGNTLQACSDDETRYEDTECAVACSDILDESDVVVDAMCSFGLCTPDVVSCADGVASTCNADASALDQVSCAGGCDIDGTACNPVDPNPTAYTSPAPAEGACDLASAPVISASGIYTVALTAPTNDFGTGFDFCTKPGTDVYWSIPARTAGTSVTVEVISAAGDTSTTDTYVALLSGVDCAAGTASCVTSDDDDGVANLSLLTYEFDGSEGDLLLLADSWGGSPFVAGDLVISIEFSDEPFIPLAPAICTADEATCDPTTSALTTCNAEGTAEELLYCELGCSDGGDACQVPLGESCVRPEPLDVSAGDVSVVLDLSSFTNDMTGNCSSSGGRDRVFSFTATVDGEYVVNTSGRDTTLYYYEEICGDTIEQCSGDDGSSPPSGWGSTVTIDAVQGTEYFFVVDLYSSGTTPTNVTLSVDVP